MTPEERAQHCRRIASAGGKARAAKLTPERRREIAALGFAAMTHKKFRGVRQKGVRYLKDKGAIPQDRPGTAEDLRALHRLACPEQYEPEETAQQPAATGPEGSHHEPKTDAGGCPWDDLPF
jgi:hypothetical protein